MMDGCRGKLVDVVSGVPQGSVLGPLLFILYTSELVSILQNKLIGYTDDSTLIGVLPSPGIRVTVAESLIRELARVSEWCDLWGMKLNACHGHIKIRSSITLFFHSYYVENIIYLLYCQIRRNYCMYTR